MAPGVLNYPDSLAATVSRGSFWATGAGVDDKNPKMKHTNNNKLSLYVG